MSPSSIMLARMLEVAVDVDTDCRRRHRKRTRCGQNRAKTSLETIRARGRVRQACESFRATGRYHP